MNQIDKERFLAELEEAYEDPKKDARVREIIVEAYRTLPVEERKAIIRRFAMESESNFDFLMDYAPELHREAFPIQ